MDGSSAGPAPLFVGQAATSTGAGLGRVQPWGMSHDTDMSTVTMDASALPEADLAAAAAAAADAEGQAWPSRLPRSGTLDDYC